jgi:prepilin-type N-terminal cleavage/methylation domain-containing protein
MKNIIFKTKKIHNGGFTLIETLVSLTLFTVVLVIAGGTIVSVIDINKRNQAISSVVNNLNYSIDSMVRDIKTGYLYKCDYDETYTIASLKSYSNPGECLDNGKSITLISTISGIDTVVKYEFVGLSGENGYINKTVYTTSGDEVGSYSITDTNNVNITDVKFSVKNPDALDCAVKNPTPADCVVGQPSVAVVIKGMAGNQQIEVSKFYVQTFISQRLINVTDFKD